MNMSSATTPMNF